MQKYVILSRLSPDALKDPKGFKKLAEHVKDHIKKECPAVAWKESHVVMGRFDIVDLIESDDPKQVEKAVMIIRTYGHCITETMPATPWKDFLDLL
ncbi:MAG TPA: GYD domain-containing protein [Deltaproteobacteria bacterium]|jgi:uncharacterized protein with GYD domain|nr:GYD domain-containing protein [Deltaproteobacteria bacterium]HQI00363.1 GYD domain-containing protein [Deltaproteobacteria bacterium]HQJ09245.1 GYD domain-containing protein [Deltaproteobacteria bacterium]